MSHLTNVFVAARAQRRMHLRPFRRWLLVAGAVGLVGVSIVLLQGSRADARPVPTAPGSALAALRLDHSVVTKLIDDVPLEPGASVAAYEW